MISKSSFFALLLIQLFALSCEHPPGATVRYFFTIQNNSSSRILYFVNNDYPDISIPDSLSTEVRLVTLSSEENFKYESSKKWPKYFNSLPADTLSIFFLSADTVSKYGWKQVQSRYLILNRKDISLQDLEDNKYLITYP